MYLNNLARNYKNRIWRAMKWKRDNNHEWVQVRRNMDRKRYHKIRTGRLLVSCKSILVINWAVERNQKVLGRWSVPKQQESILLKEYNSNTCFQRSRKMLRCRLYTSPTTCRGGAIQSLSDTNHTCTVFKSWDCCIIALLVEKLSIKHITNHFGCLKQPQLVYTCSNAHDTFVRCCKKTKAPFLQSWKMGGSTILSIKFCLCT